MMTLLPVAPVSMGCPVRDETFPPCRGSTPFASREDFRRQDVESGDHHHARQYARLRASSQVLGHEITQRANKEILQKQKAAIWSISFIKLTHRYTTLTRVFASCRPAQLNRVHGAHSFICARMDEQPFRRRYLSLKEHSFLARKVTFHQSCLN